MISGVRRHGALALRILVSAALLGVVLVYSDVGAIADAVRVATPIVVLATLIPISVGGTGIREGGFVILLGQAGVDAAEATPVSLLSATTVLLSSPAVGATYVFGAVEIDPEVAPPRRPA